MPKRTVYLPADLDQQARDAGLTLSPLLQSAVRAALRPASGGQDHGPADEWITIQDAAMRLEVGESRVHQLAAEGWLLTYREGNRRLVYAGSVARELHRRTPPYPPAAYAPRQTRI